MSAGRRISNLSKIVLRKIYRDKDKVFTIESLLRKNFPEHTSFRFVLIGANDGISHDFLYNFLQKRDCEGIAFEPIRSAFDKLRANFSIFPKVKLINQAIHPTMSEVSLFKVDERKLADLPDWAYGIASQDPHHHKRSGIEAEHIIEEKVAAGALMRLIGEHAPGLQPDYLQTDTEGFDAEIISQIDFNKIHPTIIRFEYINLDKEQKKRTIRILKNKGYYCFYDGMDIGAVQLSSILL